MTETGYYGSYNYSDRIRDHIYSFSFECIWPDAQPEEILGSDPQDTKYYGHWKLLVF